MSSSGQKRSSYSPPRWKNSSSTEFWESEWFWTLYVHTHTYTHNSKPDQNTYWEVRGYRVKTFSDRNILKKFYHSTPFTRRPLEDVKDKRGSKPGKNEQEHRSLDIQQKGKSDPKLKVTGDHGMPDVDAIQRMATLRFVSQGLLCWKHCLWWR